MNDGARNARLNEKRTRVRWRPASAAASCAARTPRPRSTRTCPRGRRPPSGCGRRRRSRPGRRRRPRCGPRRWAPASRRRCCGGSCRRRSARAACRWRVPRRPRRRTSWSRTRAAGTGPSAPRDTRFTASAVEDVGEERHAPARPAATWSRDSPGASRSGCRTGPMPVWMMPSVPDDAAVEGQRRRRSSASSPRARRTSAATCRCWCTAGYGVFSGLLMVPTGRGSGSCVK